MGNCRNVTNTFSEERRHYSNTYLEICEVYDEAVEVSVFSAVANKRIMKENKELSGEFIRMFVDTYGLCLSNDVLFDESSLFGLF